MNLVDRYTWEAETADGVLVKEGEGLAGCIRFSMIPADPALLPRHDIVGVPMVRRFGRGFHKIPLGGRDNVPCELGWTDGSAVVSTPEDLTAFFAPGHFVRQRGPQEICPWFMILAVYPDRLVLAAAYKGKTCFCVALRRIPVRTFDYVQCIVCRGFRLWVRYSDGTALVGPEDKELYL